MTVKNDNPVQMAMVIKGKTVNYATASSSM